MFNITAVVNGSQVVVNTNSENTVREAITRANANTEVTSLVIRNERTTNTMTCNRTKAGWVRKGVVKGQQVVKPALGDILANTQAIVRERKQRPVRAWAVTNYTYGPDNSPVYYNGAYYAIITSSNAYRKVSLEDCQ